MDYDKLEAELDAEILGLNLPQDGPPPSPEGHDSGETIEQAESPAEEAIPQEADDAAAQRLEAAEKRVKDAQARMTQATQEAAGLRRQLESMTDDKARWQQEKAGLEQEIQRLTAELAQAKAPQPLEEDPSLDSLLEDEYVGPLAKRNKAMEAHVKRLEQQLEAALAKVDDTSARFEESAKSAAQREQEAAYNAYIGSIKSVHPDLDRIAEMPEYAEWFGQQPPVIQYAVTKGSAQDVIYGLSQFKASIAKPEQPSNQQRLQAARAVATPQVHKQAGQGAQGKPTFTREQVDAMSMNEFAANEAIIDELIAAGKL